MPLTANRQSLTASMRRAAACLLRRRYRPPRGLWRCWRRRGGDDDGRREERRRGAGVDEVKAVLGIVAGDAEVVRGVGDGGANVERMRARRDGPQQRGDAA